MGIRMAAAADAGAVLSIYRPYITDTTVTFECTVPTTEAFTRRMEGILARFPWLVWEEAGTLLGYAYAGPLGSREAYHWSAELSIYLRPNARGRGLGKRLYGCLLELLTLQGVQNVYGRIALPNEASCGLHEAFGFSVMGIQHKTGYKQGRWLDLIWYEKALGDHPVPQMPVTVPADLDGSAVQAVMKKWEEWL